MRAYRIRPCRGLGIVEQGGMIASNTITMTPTMATPVIKSWMMFMVQSWRAEL